MANGVGVNSDSLISKWRSQNLDSELNHPALNTAHLTLSERVWAFGERYNLTWKVVSLAAIAVLGGFGLWYAGFKLAGGCVFVVTGFGAASREYTTHHEEYQAASQLYKAQKYYLLKDYLISRNSVLPSTVAECTVYQRNPLALALLFRCCSNATFNAFNREVSGSGTGSKTSLLMHLVYHYHRALRKNASEAEKAEIPKIKTLIQIAMHAGINSQAEATSPESSDHYSIANDPTTARSLPALSPLAYVQHHQAGYPHLADLLLILQPQPIRGVRA